MTIMKLFALALVLYVGYYLSMYLHRRGRQVIGETENYPIVSRVRASRSLPNFLHYIHHGHIHRPFKRNRAVRRDWLQESV